MAKTATKTKETKKEVQKFGLQVFGVIRLFQKTKKVKVKGKTVEIVEFWTNISRKDEDGEYLNKSMSVFFGKDADKPTESGLIDISSGWFFITGNEGYERISLFVDGFDIVEDEE